MPAERQAERAARFGCVAAIALAGALALCALLAGCASPEPARITDEEFAGIPPLAPLTAEEKAGDFDCLVEALRTSYPYFGMRERQSGSRWLDDAEENRRRVVDTPDNAGFLDALTEVVEQIDDGHLDVLPPEAYFSFREIYGRIPVRREWGKLLDRQDVREKHIAWLKSRHGEDARNVLTQVISQRDSARAQEQSSGMETRMLGEDAAYIRLPTFDGLWMEADGKALSEFYPQAVAKPYLLIDIRGNGGGSDLYWSQNVVFPLIKERLFVRNYLLLPGSSFSAPFEREAFAAPAPIAGLPPLPSLPPEVPGSFVRFSAIESGFAPNSRSLRYSGTILLLVDRNVFSASEAFAGFAKYSGFATLVGEQTGGDGMGVDPMLITLPASGLIVRMPLGMGLNPDGSANAEHCTQPDIVADAGLSPEELLAVARERLGAGE